MSFTIKKPLLEKNLELMAKTDTLTAEKLKLTALEDTQFCQTELGELNLCRERYGIKDYHHSQKGALKEAQELLKEDILGKNEVLYCYGIGLGYFYKAVQKWLREKPSRYLIFLEDDLQVLLAFCCTELASAILSDPQVTVFHFSDSLSYFKLYQLHSFSINRPIYFFTLPYYAERHYHKALNLCYRILYDHFLMERILNEYLNGQAGLLSNFYMNLFQLPDAYLGSGLFGKFLNVPAIICGAGPSLEKNIGLLKTLKNRALIFAGGSSLNVLNAHGLTPHFGLGIDPNPEQFHRMLTNDTFHIPFFYRNRLYNDALATVQGPKLYTPGHMHKFPSWFDKELQLEAPEIDEGHNVIHFCTEIACLMGCNPIIYVGMDLAFTEIQTYAKGISTHPLWLGTSTPYNHEKDQQTIQLKGINGEPVKTKWDWVLESEWISQYAKSIPHLKVINATEGGLGFEGIPNETLAEVVKKDLIYSYDLQTLVHIEIQNNRLHISGPEILQLVIKFRNSLKKCLEYCVKIYETAIESSPNQMAEEALNESLLYEEIGCENFLDLFDAAYVYLQRAQSFIKRESFNHLEASPARYDFLLSVLNKHLDILDKAVRNYIFSQSSMQNAESFSPAPKTESEIYQFKDSKLIIHDDLLNLHVEETFQPTQAETLIVNYPNGNVKMQSYYRDGLLHGPCRGYTENGILVAESWFIKGKQEGKTQLFYSNGNLYAIERYHQGLMHEAQEYFYENGSLHVYLSYKDGLLDGEVLIYKKTGEMFREIYYQKGLRHGVERLWGQAGFIIMECLYHEGNPVGTAREWKLNGKLKKETVIHHYPKDFDIFLFDEQGNPRPYFIHGIEDFSSYYQETQKQIDFIDGAIDVFMKHLETKIQEAHYLQEQKTIEPEMLALKEEIEKLKQLKASLTETLKKNLEEAEEARQRIKTMESS